MRVDNKDLGRSPDGAGLSPTVEPASSLDGFATSIPNASLLPCPFCGGEANVSSIRDGQQVICRACGSRGRPTFHGPAGYEATPAEAISAWNTRALTTTPEPTDPAGVSELWELDKLAALRTPDPVLEVVKEALTKAAVWFEEYAFQHGCKATQTADDDERVSRLGKSKRNKERGEYLRAALQTINERGKAHE